MTMRKWLFWGLTLVLVVALINLIIRGRRLEKQQAGQHAELVQESKATATRVLMPKDLEIVRTQMQLEEKTDGGKPASHEIEIRNNGKVAYSRFQLSFVYLDRTGRVLATRTRTIEKTMLPDAVLKLGDITFDGLPDSTAKCEVSVTYADIAHASKPQK
jgi:hypothetical protein